MKKYCCYWIDKTLGDSDFRKAWDGMGYAISRDMYINVHNAFMTSMVKPRQNPTRFFARRWDVSKFNLEICYNMSLTICPGVVCIWTVPKPWRLMCINYIYNYIYIYMYICEYTYIYISSWFTWPYCHCWTSCQAESHLGMTWPRQVPKSKVKGSELDKKSLAGPWGLHSLKNGGFLRGTPSYHPSERRFWMGKAMAKKVSPCFRKHWLWACGSILRNPLAVGHHRFCGCLVGCSHQWHPCFAHLEPCLAKAALTQQLHTLGTAKVSVMVSDILAAGLGSQVYTEIGDDGGLDHT
jgi:hypothetical protein